jgi:glycosyltransferase involved in cell wall biosynthesis
MKKVLIITYYWPPSGGSGVQRWLKCVRYLRDFGWEPVVYTALDSEYPVIDQTLEAQVPKGVEVIRRPIWEPYKLYKKFTGQKKETRVVSGFLNANKPSFKRRVSMWIRGNVFIPDARKFWIKPSVAFLVDYLKDHPVDVIVSTGPPHSMHLIAMGVKRKTGLPWVADFRDPWTNIDFYQELMLSTWADRKHHRLEKAVVTLADRVVVVGNQMKEEFEKISGRQVDVVTNGYDEADLQPQPKAARDKKFSLIHIGLLNQHRNHEAFWAACAELKQELPSFGTDLLVKLVGKADVSAQESIARHGMEAQVEMIDYLPQAEAVQQQGRAQVLLLSINNTPNAKGVITGKIFEYLASGRPILCIGPEDGDAAHIINEAKAGLVAGFEDKEKMKAHISHYYDLYQRDSLEVQSQGVAAFSRKALTGKFAQLFDAITS